MGCIVQKKQISFHLFSSLYHILYNFNIRSLNFTSMTKILLLDCFNIVSVLFKTEVIFFFISIFFNVCFISMSMKTRSSDVFTIQTLNFQISTRGRLPNWISNWFPASDKAAFKWELCGMQLGAITKWFETSQYTYKICKTMASGMIG